MNLKADEYTENPHELMELVSNSFIDDRNESIYCLLKYLLGYEGVLLEIGGNFIPNIFVIYEYIVVYVGKIS